MRRTLGRGHRTTKGRRGATATLRRAAGQRRDSGKPDGSAGNRYAAARHDAGWPASPATVTGRPARARAPTGRHDRFQRPSSVLAAVHADRSWLSAPAVEPHIPESAGTVASHRCVALGEPAMARRLVSDPRSGPRGRTPRVGPPDPCGTTGCSASGPSYSSWPVTGCARSALVVKTGVPRPATVTGQGRVVLGGELDEPAAHRASAIAVEQAGSYVPAVLHRRLLVHVLTLPVSRQKSHGPTPGRATRYSVDSRCGSSGLHNRQRRWRSARGTTRRRVTQRCTSSPVNRYR